MICVGYMDYANMFPFNYHLEQRGGFNLIKGVPSYLNRALAEGRVDVSPVSSLQYMQSPENYRIMDGLGICAFKVVKSVLLHSEVPADQLSGRRIRLTGDSFTSINLLKIILGQFYRVDPLYVQEGESADAHLIIGDRALTSYYERPMAYRYDLAEEWYKFTGLPFVFSIWLVSGKSAGVDASLNRLYSEMLSIVPEIGPKAGFYADRYLERYPGSYTREQLVDYWNTLYYSLGSEEKKGLALYYRMLGYEPRWYYYG